jgi:hypothetical protein
VNLKINVEAILNEIQREKIQKINNASLEQDRLRIQTYLQFQHPGSNGSNSFQISFENTDKIVSAKK